MDFITNEIWWFYIKQMNKKDVKKLLNYISRKIITWKTITARNSR